jgi:hypothetical protein
MANLGVLKFDGVFARLAFFVIPQQDTEPP